jgi:citrate synthase
MCRHLGTRPTPANERLAYAENFLYMLDANGNAAYRPHPAYARAIDVLFTLHAEHEMNCSTAAVRHLASSGVDVYTAVTGALSRICWLHRTWSPVLLELDRLCHGEQS